MHNVPIASGGNIATRDITDQWMNKDYMLKKSEMYLSIRDIIGFRQSNEDCLRLSTPAKDTSIVFVAVVKFEFKRLTIKLLTIFWASYHIINIRFQQRVQSDYLFYRIHYIIIVVVYVNRSRHV
jgi:hypothetical protein